MVHNNAYRKGKGRMSASGISKIAIGAIVKENSTTLLEWIAYHRVIGVNSS